MNMSGLIYCYFAEFLLQAAVARKPRVHFRGAFYHVISRGNHREIIFHDDSDRKRYLSLLE